MKKWIYIFGILIYWHLSVIHLCCAARGCCSYHGGVCGKQCCDGTELSEKCRDQWLSQKVDGKKDGASLKTKVPSNSWFNGIPKMFYNFVDGSLLGKQSSAPPLPLSVYSGCTANYVIDGDTIEAGCNGHNFRVRLWGIDTPEKKQDFGPGATRYTRSLVSGKQLELVIKGTDRYGRRLALIKADGLLVNQAIISQGYGWVYRQYCTDQEICNRWLVLEQTARKGHKGLWSQPYPTTPWRWRRLERMISVSKY